MPSVGPLERINDIVTKDKASFLLSIAAICVSLFSLGISLYFQFYRVSQQLTVSLAGEKLYGFKSIEVVFVNTGNKTILVKDLMAFIERPTYKAKIIVSDPLTDPVIISPGETKAVRILPSFGIDYVRDKAEPSTEYSNMNKMIKCGISMTIFDWSGRTRSLEMMPYTLYLNDKDTLNFSTHTDSNELIKQISL